DTTSNLIPGGPMSLNLRAQSSVVLSVLLTLLLGTTSCSSNSPTGPSATLSTITLNAASVGAGSVVQGTVALTTAAPTGGISVSLASSNSAIAAVQAAITIPA